MRKGNSDRLTPAQQAEIDVLAALPENKIDTRDMPEVHDWSGARRGVFFSAHQEAAHAADRRRRDRVVQAPYAERRGLSDEHQPRLA